MKRVVKIIALLWIVTFGLNSCVHKTTPIPNPEGYEFCKTQLEDLVNPNCYCVYIDGGWVISCE